MKKIYSQIRTRAREIVSKFPSPDFYEDFAWATELSCHFLESDTTIINLYEFVDRQLQNNLGHGIGHLKKVSEEAGALMAIEGRNEGYTDDRINHGIRIVQTAGLLHDMKRKQKNHAIEGSIYAKELLADHQGFSQTDVENISLAIRNHEAFKPTIKPKNQIGQLVSDCLYDADKFRWGPDNFTHTVWDMVIVSGIPLSKFIKYYPKNIEWLAGIKSTFRTLTGKKYGPQFIDTGIEIGKELYNVIITEFTCISKP